MTSHHGLLLILCAGLCTPIAGTRTFDTNVRRCETGTPPPDNGYDPVALVKSAEMVLLVRADSAVRVPGPPAFELRDSVRFTVPEVIDSAGSAVPRPIAVIGRLSNAPDFNRGQLPYRWTRPDGMSGMCYAYSYQRGGTFLLLLKRMATGALTPYCAGLQPVNEQVRGPDDPWVAWVRAQRSQGRQN